MVAKAGLVVPSIRGESLDRWKFDQPGTQILLIRGFTNWIDADFFCPFFRKSYFKINTYIQFPLFLSEFKS